jgi:hypothetical protein
MRTGHTYITLVCDRSGSMQMIREDAEGAVNNFIEEQKKVEGKTATLRFVEFDASSGMGSLDPGSGWLHTVFHGDIQQAPKYSLIPRGNTALLDAVGMTIVAVGEELAAMSEHDRPELVVFVIQTDGQENSSHDWNWEKLREKIKEQESKWNWQFVFLGMGADSWDQGNRMGVSNVTRSAPTAKAARSSYGNVSSAIANTRSTGDVSYMAATAATVDAAGKVKRDDDQDEETEAAKQS